MYKEIEIANTDFENKYAIRLNDKTMYVGFMVKDIIEFLKEGKGSIEMQHHFREKYKLVVSREIIDDVIEYKVNPFVIKHVDTSFKKVFTLLNPSVIPVPSYILKIFDKRFFYFMGSILLLINGYFFYESMRYHVDSVLSIGLGFAILFLILLIHEIGHWLAAKRYDTAVSEIGLGWYLFFPVLYVDLSACWRLNSKKKVIINLSGIYLQLICGVILLILSKFIIELRDMFMMVFFMNFSMIVLNVNPFLKFDGYWILSDLSEGKDLDAVSNRMLKNWMRLKKDRESKMMIVYSMLKAFFIMCMAVIFFKFIYVNSYRLYAGENIRLFDCSILFLLTLFFCGIFKKERKNCNERFTEN